MDGITGMADGPARARDLSPEVRKTPDQLREVCQEFEGMMLSNVLKQGLISAPDGEEESFPGKDVFMEFALEQVAREMGRSESMGLATSLYKQMKQDIDGNGK